MTTSKCAYHTVPAAAADITRDDTVSARSWLGIGGNTVITMCEATSLQRTIYAWLTPSQQDLVTEVCSSMGDVPRDWRYVRDWERHGATRCFSAVLTAENAREVGTRARECAVRGAHRVMLSLVDEGPDKMALVVWTTAPQPRSPSTTVAPTTVQDIKSLLRIYPWMDAPMVSCAIEIDEGLADVPHRWMADGEWRLAFDGTSTIRPSAKAKGRAVGPGQSQSGRAPADIVGLLRSCWQWERKERGQAADGDPTVLVLVLAQHPDSEVTIRYVSDAASTVEQQASVRDEGDWPDASAADDGLLTPKALRAICGECAPWWICGLVGQLDALLMDIPHRWQVQTPADANRLVLAPHEKGLIGEALEFVKDAYTDKTALTTERPRVVILSIEHLDRPCLACVITTVPIENAAC
jgi:hypothetical protein